MQAQSLKIMGSQRVTVEDTSSQWRHVKFEWRLLAFGVGIGAYFAWPAEPSLVYIAIALTLLSMLYFTCMVIAAQPVRNLVLALVFCAAGFGHARLHTMLTDAPILPSYKKVYTVSGWVEKTNRSGSLEHFYIHVKSIDNLPKEKTPKRVRVRLKPRGFAAGDAVQIKAVLYRPPKPAIVGGYDAGRTAFYSQIGGYGFAISRPIQIDLGPLPLKETLKRKIVTARYRLSRYIQMRAPPRTAGLQAALLTGDRSAIDKEQVKSLRDAGLAHLLAISGLHMGLLAGGVYSFASLCFSMTGPLARRYDMRKYAALIGAITAFGYLIVSGASVSTQRAFIMAIVVFAAIVLGRRAVSLRSVALAASITLFLHPESLMSAGFQMSFAATAALVVVYRSWSRKREGAAPKGFLHRVWAWSLGLSVTSLVAGVATGGFAALHFHRFARLGFFANLAAMPIFTLVVMPFGFLAILLMPFGLDILPLKVMGLGLDGVLQVSDWISSRESAIAHIKGANGLVTGLFGFGFCLLCVGPKIMRYVGVGILLAACILWAKGDRPDIRVSETARVSFWDDQDADLLRVDRMRGDRFGRKRFTEQAGLDAGVARKATYLDTTALCDSIACRFSLKAYRISIVHSPEGVPEACLDSDLVVLTLRTAGVRARRTCKAIILDAKDLAEQGARDVYLKQKGIVITPANPKTRRTRPWGQ